MPLVSALNGDNRNIQAGCPVAGKLSRLQLDRVILAGGSVLAAGIVKSGAVANGVINLFTDGIVDLPDWTLATGSKYLTVGATYRLSSTRGKLTKLGTGQVIGMAVSGTQLSLQISSSDGTALIEELADTSDAVAIVASDLSAHIAQTIVHGTGSNVVGVNDEQTLERKTIGLTDPRYGRFSSLQTSSSIAAGDAVTLLAGCFMITAGPFTVNGILTIEGYFSNVAAEVHPPVYQTGFLLGGM